jgi:hypothetical protein
MLNTISVSYGLVDLVYGCKNLFRPYHPRGMKKEFYIHQSILAIGFEPSEERLLLGHGGAPMLSLMRNALFAPRVRDVRLTNISNFVNTQLVANLLFYNL